MENEKARFEVVIRKRILDEFRKFVFRKHGKLYKVFGDEVEKALKFYLETMDKETKEV